MVYRFVVLSDEDEAFVREFEFLESHNLLDFHNAIQEELEFDRSQIASFYMATDSWEKEEEFTLFDMGAGSSTMENAVLEDVIFRKNQKLLYVFDFFNDRALFIEYVGESKEIEEREYPLCTNSKGLPPKQVTFGGVSRKKYNNLIVTDDEEEEVVDDEIFFDSEDDESLGEFDNIENVEEEE
ncbi:MAG: plasmid pRiA4b ORF-3 family protein [Bacteroidales bacterium]|nr:plasmid pRiA4b ORF-3 family protein [Bacteroidales bacterium]